MLRKRAGEIKETTVVEDRHLIIEKERQGRKTAPELTTELYSSRQQQMSLSIVKNRLRSVEGEYAEKTVKGQKA